MKNKKIKWIIYLIVLIAAIIFASTGKYPWNFVGLCILALLPIMLLWKMIKFFLCFTREG